MTEKKCLHLNARKEYYNGTHTLDYICEDCSEIISRETYLKGKEIRQNSK